MSLPVKRNQIVAKRKGTLAAVTAGGAVAVGFLVSSPLVALVGLVGAGYLTWDWVQFRIKNGMRF